MCKAECTGGSGLYLGKVGCEDQQRSFPNTLDSPTPFSPLASLQRDCEIGLTKCPVLLMLLSKSHTLRSMP